MDNTQVAALLNEMALFLTLDGADAGVVSLFRQAARMAEGHAVPLEEMAAVCALFSSHDAGSPVLLALEEYLASGHIESLDLLHGRFPETVLELLEIPEISPELVRLIYVEHEISTLERLRVVCENEELAQWKGFNRTLQESILARIGEVEQQRRLFRANDALLSAALLADTLAQADPVGRVAIAGSLRRHKELVRNIDLVVTTEDNDAARSVFYALTDIEKIGEKNTSRTTTILKNGIPVTMHPVRPEEYAIALSYYTGSRGHNAQLRRRAREMGWRLTAHGLFDEAHRKIVCNDEAALYSLLKLPYIPPELRENFGEFDVNRISRLVTLDDLKGVVHSHSTWSDGGDSLEDLARAAAALEYGYLVITDHSQSADYVNGLTPDRVLEQHQEIDRINREFSDFRILKGIESDIRIDGTLDYEEALLRRFEVVIVSVHSDLEMSEKAATRRIIRALEQPYAMILGHPTGRLLLSRAGYPVDMKKIIDAAIANGVAIEINANPRRLDMDWRYLRQARDKGARFVIGPDAHRIAGLHNIRYGVGVARKGWLTPKDVLNCLPAEEFLRCLRKG